MEYDPFIDDFPIKTSIYSGFSMAMLNNQMVNRPIEKMIVSHVKHHLRSGFPMQHMKPSIEMAQLIQLAGTND